jgi:long-chain fatty acid transport protein
MHLTPDVAVGLSLNSPFGLSTDWDSQWAGMFHAVKSKVETLNVNPALAWRVNKFLSLGAGVSYQRLKATLTSAASLSTQARLDGSDWAWGWNVGALGDFGQGTRVGLTYRSAVNYKLTGDLWINNPAATPLSAAANLKVPQVASIAIAQQIGPKLRLLADYTWTGWDSVQTLAVIITSGPASGFPASVEQLNFKNTWRAGLGAEYQMSPLWLLRAGVAYDRSPVQDEFRTPRLPDNDRTWLAIGASLRPNEQWTVDFGYAYIFVKDGSSNLVDPQLGNLKGTYSSNINILGLQASMRF